MRSLFSGLLVYCIGCVIPTPLEAEPTPAAGRPIIIDAEPRANKTDAFGVVSYPTTQEFLFSVTALDDNVNEQLWLRIFHVNGEQYSPLTSSELMAQDDTTPAKRVHTYSSNTYCCFVAGNCAGTATDQLVTAIVAKENINMLPANLGKPDLAAGTFDQKFWVLSCL